MAQCSFSRLQKSSQNHCSYVWTDAPVQYGFRAGAKAIQYSMNI